MTRHGMEWGLFLLALTIAAMIKLVVHDREKLSERIVEAQVIYSPPARDLVSYELVDKVRIGVRGTSNDVSRLLPFAVEVVAQIPAGRTGATEIVLENDDVRFAAKGDFEIFSIEPNRFTIQVERQVVEEVPIRVKFSGEPAAGARPAEPFVDPPKAVIRGPESRVARTRELVVPIDLGGHARSFNEVVGIFSPDPVLQVVEPNLVRVSVPMEEPRLSVTYEDLPAAPGTPKAGANPKKGVNPGKQGS